MAKSAAEVRNQLGLTQARMAEWLGVTKSLLSMAELDKRDLPTAALLKLAELELFVKRHAINQTTNPQQQAKALQALAAYTKELVYKQTVAQRKLAVAEKAYSESILLLDFINHVKANADDPKLATHPSWLDWMGLEAQETMEQNGMEVQAILEVQISGLQQQIAHARKLSERYSG